MRYGGMRGAAGVRGNGAAGSGPRRCAFALEARARLPRHLRRDSPPHLAAPARHSPSSFNAPVHVSRTLRAWLRPVWPGAPKVRP